MTENITVYVNDTPVLVRRGSQVQHALIAYSDSVYRATTEGAVWIEDARGFKIGLTGSLGDGAKLYVKSEKPDAK